MKFFFIYCEIINFIKKEILKMNIMKIEIIKLFRLDIFSHTSFSTSFHIYFLSNISFISLLFDYFFSFDIPPPSPSFSPLPPSSPPPIQNQDLGLRKVRVKPGA